MKAGARNKATGKVVEIIKGTLMCEVKIEVTDDMMVTSVMTLESLGELGISEGDTITAYWKAVNVLLVKD
jgi:molybdate transport system regulatory protein